MTVRRSLLALLALPLLGAASPAPYGPELNGRIFDRVWTEVERRYWDPALHGLDWSSMEARYRPRAVAAHDGRGLYAVLDAMLGTLHDSHVFVLPPAEVTFDSAYARGEAQAGFGFSAWQDGGTWRVFQVRAGSPAAMAGVQIGWTVLSIDGRPLDMGFRPSEGADARLVFVDEHAAQHSLMLRSISLDAEPERRATTLPGNLLLIGLDGFSEGDDRWLSGQLRDRAPAGVILDLRENGGGEAIVAARVAGGLFPAKRTLLQRIGRKKTEDVPVLGAGRRAYMGPLVVLVGPRSASGAEALAALVEESGRGVTIGERTSGSLTAASLYPLPDGGQLSVAVYDVRTPDGVRLEGRGFVPRQIVKPSIADLRGGRDPVLARAAALLRGGQAPNRTE